MIENKVCWGIVGLGQVAQRFASDLVEHVTNGTLYGVAAREQHRANLFANKYHCEKSYDSYQSLAQDSCVDAVYIATIHPFHKNMVELFLKNGKHVLVEKPAFTNVKDWDEMELLAKENKLLLVEAMKSVAFPVYQAMRKFIADNKIKINYIEAAFGNWHKFDANQPIFNANLSGGATLDVGVYGLWLYCDLCQLTQSTVSKPFVTISQDNKESKVDENVEFIFSGEVEGKISASITRDLKREAIIKGDNLEIIIHDKWWNPKNIDILYQGEMTKITRPERGGGFVYEIEHISSLIINNKYQSDLIPSDISRQVISIMETSLIENGFGHLVGNR